MVANVEWLTTAFHQEREYIFLGHLDFSLADISDENESEQFIKMSYDKKSDLTLKYEELDLQGQSEEDNFFSKDTFLNNNPQREPVLLKD